MHSAPDNDSSVHWRLSRCTSRKAAVEKEKIAHNEAEKKAEEADRRGKEMEEQAESAKTGLQKELAETLEARKALAIV